MQQFNVFKCIAVLLATLAVGGVVSLQAAPSDLVKQDLRKTFGNSTYLLGYSPVNHYELSFVEGSGRTEVIAGLGAPLVYGVSDNRLATIAGTKNGFELKVYDLKTKATIASYPVKDQIQVFISGPEPQVIFSPDRKNLFYLTMSGLSFYLNRTEIANGKTERFLVPQALTPAYLIGLPQGAGVYRQSTGQLLLFDPTNGSFDQLVEGQVRSAVRRPLVSYHYLPEVGLVQTASHGTVSLITDQELNPLAEKLQFQTKLNILKVQVGQHKGKPVLFLASSEKPQAGYIDSLSALDPSTGETVWENKLSFPANSFSISNDEDVVRLIDLRDPGLVALQKETGEIQRITSLSKDWAGKMRIVPLGL